MSDFSKLNGYNVKDAQARTMIKSLDSSVTVLQNDYIVVIGDSYADGWSPDGSSTSWVDRMARNMGYTLGTDMFTKHEGGAGFVGPGNRTGSTFQGLLTTLIADMSSEARSKVKHVLVAGGINDDDYTEEQILTAIGHFVTTAKSGFPNLKKVSVAYISRSVSLNAWKQITVTIPAYTKCGSVGATYVTNSEFILWNSEFFSSDNIHPLSNGLQAIADYLTSYMIGGNLSVDVFASGNLTAGHENVSNIVHPAMNVWQKDNIITVLANSVMIVLSSPVQLSWDSYVDLLNYDNPILNKNKFGFYNITCAALVQDDSNFWHNTTVTLRFNTTGKIGFIMGGIPGINIKVKQINLIGTYFILPARQK